jgi:hypothetical protein
MSEEKPLHVRVGEAIGWDVTREHDFDDASDGRIACVSCGLVIRGDNYAEPCVPRYDTDWSATGALIERYGISLALHHRPPTEWVAFVNTIGLAWGEDCFGLDGYADDFEYGPTPLVAVCNLILAMKAAGKLEPAA